jgi:hypothetical protein
MSIRDRLIKLFRALGNANVHERDNARGLIDELLRKQHATWSDLPVLLSTGSSVPLSSDLIRHVADLGSLNPQERNDAFAWLADLE